jgi:hypothetical protein
MGGMLTEPFKLDRLALWRSIRPDRLDELDLDDALRELASQLHAAGAPDLPFEEQARVLLSDHLAMRAAGGEMPSVESLTGGAWDELWSLRRALDLFRPLLAKRTRERDEARAERDALVERNSVQKGRLAEVFYRLTEEQATRLKEGENREASEGAWHEATGCAGPDDARAEMARLRARIADLEAQLAARRVEPGADVVERLTCVYLKALNAPVTQDMVELPSPRTAMAAVLSALAEMGEEALPSSLDILATVSQGGAIAHGVHAMLRAKVSPVLGALRARVAEFEGVATERDEYRAQIEEHVEEAQRLKNRLAALEAESSHHQATVAALREASKPWATRKFLEGLRDRADEPLKSAIAELLEVGK